MQSLKKLIFMLSQNEQKNLASFEKLALKGKKELSLFCGVLNGSFQSDHGAAQALYQSAPSDTKYVLLKNRLEEKILNYLVYVDLTDDNVKSLSQKERKCELLLYQAKMLLSQGESGMSEKMLKKTLRLAKENEFTHIASRVIELLLDLYISSNKLSLYQSIREQYMAYNHRMAVEKRASLLYKDAKAILLANEEAEKASAYLSQVVLELEELWRKGESFNLFQLYYLLLIDKLQLERNYAELYLVTSFSEKYWQGVKINYERFDKAHNYALFLQACLRTHQIMNGLKMAGLGQYLFEQGSSKWVDYQENYFLLILHVKDYLLAVKVIKQVEESLISNKALQARKEKWGLYKVYLHWMQGEENTLVVLEDKVIKQLFVSYKNDKQGYHIAILFLQFCHYLASNQKDLLVKKGETYKKYMERHMQGEAFNRERLFFLLLILVIRHNFQVDLITKKAAKVLSQLKQCPLPGGALVSPIEIIPYEHLWEKILQVLSTTKGRPKKVD